MDPSLDSSHVLDHEMFFLKKETFNAGVKKKAIRLKCGQEGPCGCSAHIASKLSLCVSMAKSRADVGSNCSKDTTSASLLDNVQGLNYVPSLQGDENMNIGDEEVEIPLWSSPM
jgi:hypothetical protein